MRESPAGGLYVVTAAVVALGDQQGVEDRLRSALGGRRRRVHWHSESHKDREALVELLAGLELRAVCAAVQPTVPRRQERARERALWTLVPELVSQGVVELVLEARQEQLNRRDVRTIGAIHRAALIEEKLAHRFAVPDRQHPLLWAADIVAGAVGLEVADCEDRYTKRLPEGFVTVHYAAR